MIPEAAHRDFSQWVHAYKDSPRYISQANKVYAEKKVLQLSTIAFRYSKTKQEYQDLFKELQSYYLIDDSATEPYNYCETAPEHNENVNTEGVRAVFTFLIIIMGDLLIFSFVVYLTRDVKLALWSVPFTTTILYILIKISRKPSKK